MVRSPRAGRRGFTLVELLVVVALIAIISGMVVALMSGVTDKSAATVSMATQKQLTNQINAFRTLHDQAMPDQFDSVIQADYATAGGTYETVGSHQIAAAASLTDFIPQDVPPGPASVPQNRNRGVFPAAYSGTYRTLTVKQLTTSDVSALNGMGIYTVYDSNNAEAFHGSLGYTLRPLAAGQPICIVDPQSVSGQAIYKDFGIDLSDDTHYPKDANGELTAAARETALTAGTSGAVFYVLALGPNCTMVGTQTAGVQEAPACGTVSYGFYNRYMVVIRSTLGPYFSTPAFAGVLDAKGQGPTSARSSVNSIQ